MNSGTRTVKLSRVEERSKADLDFCLEMFNSCLHAGVTDEDIVKVFRLGRRSEIARPLMLQVAGYTVHIQKLNHGVIV